MELQTYCERVAAIAVEIGANVQHDQILGVTYSPGMEPLVYEVARSAYRRGARFVDPFVFDTNIKRIRLEEAREETLEFVPDWWGQRALAIGATRSARIMIHPTPEPGVLDGVDPERAAKDQLPVLKEGVELLNDRSTNWTLVPFPTPRWAAKVHPDLPPDEALQKLTDQLAYILRLDEADPAAAWQARSDQLVATADRLTGHRFDALHFRGPGTDLTVGLLRGSVWSSARLENAWGVTSYVNLPSEEIFTTPDPERTSGTVTATKPLDVGGTLIEGLRVGFENGHAVTIDADSGADVLRSRAAKDDGASRLGEVALVDNAGRIAESGSVFFNTLLDENAASHIALGNAYRNTAEESEWERINQSEIHIDFMIGSNELDVAGVDADGNETPVLVRGEWKV